MRQPTAWVILVVGAVLSLFAWRSLVLEVDEAARVSFKASVLEARAAIQTRLLGYHIALSGLQGLFHADGSVDRAAFSRYAASIPAEHGARVRSFSYAQRVTAPRKAAYERATRPIRPAGDRPEYLPLQFVEPLARNQVALGLDILADPARRASLLRARDTGAVAATPPFVLMSEPESGSA